MSGSYAFTYEELVVMVEGSDESQPLTLVLELDCTQLGEDPSGLGGPPEFADPGCSPEFQLDYALIEMDDGIADMELTPQQYDTFLGDKLADMIYELAVEAATESGEFG